jgi:hypothetical protein
MASTVSASAVGVSLNRQAQQRLALQVAKEFLGTQASDSALEIGPISVNNYSFTFSVTLQTGRSVFVKVPKLDMRGTVPQLLPISPGDREMALEEESSLKMLRQRWSAGGLGVEWVRLLGGVAEYNAIVTERVIAEEALVVFRRLDLRRRLGFEADADRLRRLMARLGAAFGQFHQSASTEAEYHLSSELPKFEFYCRELAPQAGGPWPEAVIQTVRSLGDLRIPGSTAPTLKGIDVRNTLVDSEDHIFLLDPGKTKIAHREADLARFLMTYRILYWGSKMLLLVREPDSGAEAAFLESYYAQNPPSCRRLLSLYMLKEQLKHWHTAVDSLERRPWPSWLKRLAARVYVAPFYERQVSDQLRILSDIT